MKGSAEGMSWGLACTWRKGAEVCGVRAPGSDNPEDAGKLAIKAGWRIWRSDRTGLGDPSLRPGEALCPLHLHEPSMWRPHPA